MNMIGNEKILESTICRDFLRSACSRGKRCKFRHPSPAECETLKLSFSGPSYCRDHLAGQCQRVNCKYLHFQQSAEEITQAPELYPAENLIFCKDYLKRNCRRGFSCKYRHISGKDKNQQSQFIKQCFPCSSSNSRLFTNDAPSPVLQATAACQPQQQVFIQIDPSGQLPSTNAPTPLIAPVNNAVPATLIHSQSGATTAILQPAHLHQPVFVENALFASSRPPNAIPVVVATNSHHQKQATIINQVATPTPPPSFIVQTNSAVAPSIESHHQKTVGNGSESSLSAEVVPPQESATLGCSTAVSDIAASAAMAAASAIVKSAARGDSTLINSCSSTIKKLMPELLKASNSSLNKEEPVQMAQEDQIIADSRKGEDSFLSSADSNRDEAQEAACDDSKEDKSTKKEDDDPERQLALTAATVAVVAAAAAIEQHQQEKIKTVSLPISSAAGPSHLILPISTISTSFTNQPLSVSAMQRFAVADANRKHRQAQLEQELNQAAEELFLSDAFVSPQADVEEEDDEEEFVQQIANLAELQESNNSKRRRMNQQQHDGTATEAKERAEFQTQDEEGEERNDEAEKNEDSPMGIVSIGKIKKHHADFSNQNMINYLRFSKRKHRSELMKMRFKVQDLIRENCKLRASNQMLMEQNIRLRQSSKQVVEAARMAETAAAQVISSSQLDPPTSRYILGAAPTVARSSTHLYSSLTSTCTAPITFTVNSRKPTGLETIPSASQGESIALPLSSSSISNSPANATQTDLTILQPHPQATLTYGPSFVQY
ncbi:hypothetical protein Ciccas_002424 [Cichlidogyrus casuarinus]|uniref:C3H1-type domain-containing protein n=1 Tax=Cichlidogyrus casuarinus TaxID=1844966 RepID=A0ABD2QH97_9PLAT